MAQLPCCSLSKCRPQVTTYKHSPWLNDCIPSKGPHARQGPNRGQRRTCHAAKQTWLIDEDRRSDQTPEGVASKMRGLLVNGYCR